MQKPFSPKTQDISHGDTPRSIKPFSPRRPQSPATPTPPREIEGGLKKLIESMKPSFFPQGNDVSLRLTILSSVTHADPFMIVRSGE